jgi:hypothetical protein
MCAAKLEVNDKAQPKTPASSSWRLYLALSLSETDCTADEKREPNRWPVVQPSHMHDECFRRLGCVP